MTPTLKLLAAVGAAAFLVLPALAFAQAAGAPAGGPPRAPPKAARGPSLDLSLEAAQTAIATCKTNGYTVASSVIDSAGVLKVLVASDGAAMNPVTSSTRKAEAALKYKKPTSDIENDVKTDAALAAAITADQTMMARAGALPLVVNGEVIGAIGVGGAPGGDKDQACAKAGLDKIASRLQ